MTMARGTAAVPAALSAILLALAAPAFLAQTSSSPSGSTCVQDEVVLDGNADGVVSVGDAILAPPEAAGKVDSGTSLLNRPLVAFPGDVSYLDTDANGAPSFRDVALFDRGSDGRGQGDILLGNTTWSGHTYAAGHILRASDPLPAANVYAYGSVSYFDENSDGRRQPEEGVYGAAGGALSAGDVRVAVDDWPPGSFVRASDSLVGQPLTAGPVIAVVDEDGSGGFTIASCPSTTSFPSEMTSPTSSTSSSSSASGSSSPSTASPSPSPLLSSSASSSTSGKNPVPGLGFGLAAAALAAAAFTLRRRQ